jgi:excinuclease ABC subunit C
MSSISYQDLPSTPGVYIMKNAAGRILYVGKAKNLRRRVASYFTRTKDLPADKKILISQVKKLEHIVTDTEIEALLLEATLIKRHRPKFNIRFKDDKNFQYIKVDYFWDFPKIYSVRQIEDTNRAAQYFGPFTDGWAVRQTITLLRKLFRYRTCNRKIPYDFSLRYSRPCLNYHIKLCLGPCIGAVSKEEYDQTIRNCVRFLQGRQPDIRRELKAAMRQAAAAKNFELAARLRDQLRDIEHISARQKVVSTKKEDFDVVSFFAQKQVAAFNVFLVRQGNLIGKQNFLLDYNEPLQVTALLESFLQLYYSSALNRPRQIVIPEPISPAAEKLLTTLIGKNKKVIIIPRRGKLKKLITLGVANARDYRQRQQEIPTATPITALANLQKILHLKKTPRRVETYDISNLQGTNATGAMAVFQDGRPNKSQYRRFRIRRRPTPDDTAMLTEVLQRRWQHHDWPRPDLVLIDGGRPQLNAARRIIPAGIPVISLAKRGEEIYQFEKTKPLRLNRDNTALQLLQQMRDEAHRFAISHHLGIRKKRGLTSQLDKIPGIGPATKKKLLRRFYSVAGIKAADEKTVATLVGQKKAKLLKENL